MSIHSPSNLIDTIRKAELEEQQHADSLRPGTLIGQSELEDLNAAIENAPFEEHHDPKTCIQECCADGPDFEQWVEENTYEERTAEIESYRSGK